MIELFYWPTPNGWKISIMLEECELPYELRPVNIGRGEQFKPEFLKISPNNRMPAIIDHDPPGGGAPMSVFESGAILVYLAEKTGRFMPKDLRGRFTVLEWVMWQMGGLGPMAGQASHFMNYAPEKIPYAIERYSKEVQRLVGVLNTRLEGRDFIAGEYSIADMASWPWTQGLERFGFDLSGVPNVKRWIEAMRARPAVVRAIDVGKDLRQPTLDAEAKKVLFGHDPEKK